MLKIKKQDFLFYIAYFLLYISFFLGDLNIVYDDFNLQKIIRIVSYVLLLISLIDLKLSKRELKFLFLIFLLLSVYSYVFKDLYWNIICLLIYRAKYCDVKTIFKISLFTNIISICIVLTLCYLGVLPDIVTYRDSFNTYSNPRHSLGFVHSNVLPLLILYCFIYYTIINENRTKLKFDLFFLLCSIIIYVTNNSRNAFLLTCILFISTVTLRKITLKDKYKEMIYSLTRYSVVFLSLFSYCMTFLLLRGGIWDKIDNVFSGRFRLAIFKIRSLGGIKLLNLMNNNDFSSDNIMYVTGDFMHNIIIDNGYLYVIIRYGLLILIFYYMVCFRLSKYYRDKPILLITIMLVFVSNFIDNDLVDYSFLPFILLAFNYKNTIEFRLEEKLI